jgi:hypothetical protein
VHLQVALSTEGVGGRALRAIRQDPGENCFPASWHGVGYVSDRLVTASFTSPLGPLQCRRACGKTASTLPVHGDDRFAVHRPWPRGFEGSDVACPWWQPVTSQRLFPHEDLEGVTLPALPYDLSQPSGAPCLRTHLSHPEFMLSGHIVGIAPPGVSGEVAEHGLGWCGLAVVMTPAPEQGAHLRDGVHCWDVVVPADPP